MYQKRLAASKCVLWNAFLVFNALIKLPSDGVAVLNSKCQVHIGSDASFKCRDDSTYTYSCQVCEGVGNGGLSKVSIETHG